MRKLHVVAAVAGLALVNAFLFSQSYVCLKDCQIEQAAEALAVAGNHGDVASMRALVELHQDRHPGLAMDWALRLAVAGHVGYQKQFHAYFWRTVPPQEADARLAVLERLVDGSEKACFLQALRSAPFRPCPSSAAASKRD